MNMRGSSKIGKRSNQSMKANGPVAKQLQSDCHDTLLWLISVSLGHMNAVSRYLD
jgi:hypothetical protein